MPSLHALSLKEVTATGAHYGVSSDASTAIALIALSRLMRVKDARILESVAASPLASAVLAALRASVLRHSDDEACLTRRTRMVHPYASRLEGWTSGLFCSFGAEDHREEERESKV